MRVVVGGTGVVGNSEAAVAFRGLLLSAGGPFR